MPLPTPEAWAEIRHAYEHSDRLVEDICADHGISSGMLRDRVRRWQWTKRRQSVPSDGPPAVAMEARADLQRAASEAKGEPVWGDGEAQRLHPVPLQLADASRSNPPPQEPACGLAPARPGWEGDVADASPAATVARLQGAVSRVLPAIEAVIALLAAKPHAPREMERAGRTLNMLTRTLRELNALLAQTNAQAAARRRDEDDDSPKDMDAFRNKLAARIEAFLASRPDDDFGCPAAAPASSGGANSAET